MRNISFAMTTAQIQDRSKDVTRRLGWRFAKVGMLLQPVKKGMGLKPGEQIEKLCAPIIITAVHPEPLNALTDDLDYGFAEVAREGFVDHPTLRWPSEWVKWFCASHGSRVTPATIVTRIEFKYTEEDSNG